MSRKRLPWKLQASDYSQPRWYVRPTVAYELLFEFLRLSPSYELARKEAEDGLPKGEQLPPDFNEVRRTYALLGNVQTALFRDWWLQRGLRAFGNPSMKPRVHSICLLAGGQDVRIGDVTPPMEQYVSETRRDEGLGPALLIALPLNARRAEVLKQVTRLLDEHAKQRTSTDRPVLTLQGQRLRAKVLFNGIRLLWFKAAKPRWELWRLGAKARLSPTYSKVLDPAAPRRVTDVQQMIDREMMSKITHRALVKFQAIAENAARGKFPSDEPVAQVPFDFPKLARIIQCKNTWEATEKARLLRAFEARRVRRSAEPPDES
jgi:hypothetical protein